MKNLRRVLKGNSWFRRSGSAVRWNTEPARRVSGHTPCRPGAVARRLALSRQFARIPAFRRDAHLSLRRARSRDDLVGIFGSKTQDGDEFFRANFFFPDEIFGLVRDIYEQPELFEVRIRRISFGIDVRVRVRRGSGIIPASGASKCRKQQRDQYYVENFHDLGQPNELRKTRSEPFHLTELPGLTQKAKTLGPPVRPSFLAAKS
ncbi:MAG: hypothetical protein UZ17_ACD001001213 [Acidobacteria bacterium OLB17]|nr:MAG: hypothetical protein UZ17_ACD001001213 [Acidobacteria bacterium OLB17]